MKKNEIMKILRGYQKQTRAGDGKLKPQFPRPNIASFIAMKLNVWFLI